MKLKASLAALAVLALFALCTLFGSFYTVSEGYRAVLTRNNAVIGEAAPGLHFKLPFVDGATEMSVKTEKLVFENMAVYSRDIQTAGVTMSLNSRLDPASVLNIYSTVGTDYSAKVVWPVVFDRTKNVLGQYTAADIIAKRSVIATEIMTEVAQRLASRGVIVESIQIENIDFSDAYEAASEATAKAQAEVLKSKQELEQVRVSAQQQTIQAEAAAMATKATADAQAYATRAAGEAEAEAIKARGAALRDNPQLVDLITAEKWNGVLPTTQVPGSAVPFINVK